MDEFTNLSSSDVETYAYKKYAQFLNKEGATMRPTLERMDQWMIKGLDGISDAIINRSRIEEPIDRCHTDELRKSITLLEACLNNNQVAYEKCLDKLMVQSLIQISYLLYKRMTETGLGPFASDHKNQLQMYVTRLRTAYVQLQEVVKES